MPKKAKEKQKGRKKNTFIASGTTHNTAGYKVFLTIER